MSLVHGAWLLLGVPAYAREAIGVVAVKFIGRASKKRPPPRGRQSPEEELKMDSTDAGLELIESILRQIAVLHDEKARE